MKSIKINGIKWKLKPFRKTTEEYDGRTNVPELTIEINISQCKELIKKTIIHELVHAHLDSFGFGSYTTGQLNIEQVCEFISFNAENIIKIANKIMEKYL